MDESASQWTPALGTQDLKNCLADAPRAECGGKKPLTNKVPLRREALPFVHERLRKSDCVVLGV